MVNVTRCRTPSPRHIIQHTNLLSLRIDDCLSINRLELLSLKYVVGVEMKSVEHCDFFCLRWADLGCPPPYV